MKIVALNYFDEYGGAARAAYRIHKAVQGLGIDSRMLVVDKRSTDWTVDSIPTLSRLYRNIGGRIVQRTSKFLSVSDNPVLHSFAMLPTRQSTALNRSDAELVHMHWINGEMLSMADIGAIRKPVVWTLHDMWAFCGAEHMTHDLRWKEGYLKSNRGKSDRGFDIDRLAWLRKRKNWRRPFHIVCPSNWLATFAKESLLMANWPIYTVPNAIDTETWMPLDKTVARQLLGLPLDMPLIMFGAWGGARDPRKGFDLLQSALRSMRSSTRAIGLVVLGQMRGDQPLVPGFQEHYLGHLHDDLSLRVAYSAVDAVVVPSRQDNLPNAAVEAHACGTPVVAFDIGGLPDIVVHEQTGYLARGYDTDNLAAGIIWTVSDNSRNAGLRTNARRRAVAEWSYPVVAHKYAEIYKKAVSTGRD